MNASTIGSPVMKIPPPHNASVLRSLVRAGLALACFAGILVSATVYRSEGRIESTLRAMVAGDANEAMLGELEDSETRLNPDSLREQTEAIVLARMGRAEEAERLMLDVVKREPENQLVWVTLARVQATAGNDDAARRSHDRGEALNSRTPDLDVPPPLVIGKP
jgi:Flp pilus assembly protein TadD